MRPALTFLSFCLTLSLTFVEQHTHTNRLTKEKSPYLLQHAHNPVDWYPWGDEAFEKAKREDKPVFLSIGYSTCHWCHVMERESFESDSIAQILNEYFVAIKVDREERPDIDNIYMTAVQAMTGSGGWPLSLFLTADRKPFFGGTYFPPASAYGRPGFPDVLRRIHEVWTSQRAEVLEQAEHLISTISEYGESNPVGSSTLPTHAEEEAFTYFASTFDKEFAGFCGAPKFPRPVIFNFLFSYWYGSKKEEARDMSLSTLRAMATGGMNDQLGGGFHRYSVDREWRVSHFEKMLYDQAQLVNSYIDAYQITHDEFYADVVRNTLDYILRDMTHSGGAFYSAEDADSEGEEGKFYVWTKEELDGLLGKERSDILSYYYGVTTEGNFEHGKSVLHVTHSPEEVAKHFSRSRETIQSVLDESKKTLFTARARRIRPHLDDKILASWNGLAIGAFARAGAALNEERFLHAAERAAEFIFSKMYRDKRLLRRWRDGEARFAGFLDDYAFLIHGLIDLYQSTGNTVWLDRSVELTQTMIERFYDEANGGFYFSAHTGREEQLVVKTKQDYDGAEPAGNSIATLDLLRLAELTGNRSWREKALRTLELFSPVLHRAPYAMPELLVAFEWATKPVKQVVIVGPNDASDTKAMMREIATTYLPFSVVISIDPEKKTKHSVEEFFSTLPMTAGKATAYICEHSTCQLPVTDREALKKILHE